MLTAEKNGKGRGRYRAAESNGCGGRYRVAAEESNMFGRGGKGKGGGRDTKVMGGEGKDAKVMMGGRNTNKHHPCVM